MQETGLGKYSSLEPEATVGKEITEAVMRKVRREQGGSGVSRAKRLP